MKSGHFIALIGAAMALAGGLAEGFWQAFTMSGINAAGLEVKPAGQIVVALAGLTALCALAGLLTRHAKKTAKAALVFSSFAIAWVLIANVTRKTAFFPADDPYFQYETVTLLGGYTLALSGAFIMFFGNLVTLAVEPKLDPNKDYLRVALIWNDTILEEKVLREPQTFTIGESRGADFVIPDSAFPKSFPLFRLNRKREYSIGLAEELSGDITINQQTKSLQDFRGEATRTVGGVSYVPLARGDWGMISAEEVNVFFQFVRPEPAKATGGLIAFDESLWASLATSLALQAGLVVWAIVGWNPDYSRIAKLNEVRYPTADIQVAIQEKQKEEEEEEEDDSTAKKAPDEEGKFGDPEEDPEKKNKIPKHDGRMVKKVDPKKVGLNDLLSTNKLGGQGAIANLLKSASEGFTNKLAVAMAGSGTEFELGHGAGGLGFAGTGSGGGGEGGAGRIHGLGKIDTGGGMGVKAGLGKKKKRRVGRMRLRGLSGNQFCKKGDIRSKIRRRGHAIRACYERQLMRSPKLSGKITARWQINLQGRVRGLSTGGSLRNGSVRSCIARVIRRIRFRPPDGGTCYVRFPFVFNPGG
mgnify:CR=1 FL=1